MMLIAIYERLTSWLKFDGWLGLPEGFSDGFWAGLSLALIIVLIYILLKWRCCSRNVCKSIIVPGDHGDLVVTLNAVREFIKRIVSQFGEASLENVTIRHRRGELMLTVDLVVVPNTDLIPLRDMIQQRIISDAAERLGLQTPLRVDIQVRSMEADGRRIQKKHRKFTPDSTIPEAASLADSDAIDEHMGQ